MSIEAGSPPAPPQLSPDGKWVWDGAAWRPIAIHEAAFPTWRSVGADLPLQPAAAQPVARAVVPQSMPVPAAAAVIAPAPDMAVPLWQQGPKSTGINKYLYGVAGGVALLVIGAILTSFGPVSFPWSHTADAPAPPKLAPALTSRSDYARADRLVNVILAPAFDDTNQSLSLVKETCYGGMTSGCEDAVIAADNQIGVMLRLIDQQASPACVSYYTTHVRADLATTDAGLQLALKAYKDNRATELAQGLAEFRTGFARSVSDETAMGNAAKACDTQVTGP